MNNRKLLPLGIGFSLVGVFLVMGYTDGGSLTGRAAGAGGMGAGCAAQAPDELPEDLVVSNKRFDVVERSDGPTSRSAEVVAGQYIVRLRSELLPDLGEGLLPDDGEGVLPDDGEGLLPGEGIALIDGFPGLRAELEDLGMTGVWPFLDAPGLGDIEHRGLQDTMVFESTGDISSVIEALELREDVAWVQPVTRVQMTSIPNDPYFS